MNDGNIGDAPWLLPIYEVTSEWYKSIKSLSEASIDVRYIFVKGGKSDGSGNPLQDARWYLAWIREHHMGWSMHCLRWHAKGKGKGNTQYSQSAVWWFIRSVGCGGRNHDGCRRRCLLKIATGEHGLIHPQSHKTTEFILNSEESLLYKEQACAKHHVATSTMEVFCSLLSQI